MTDLPSDPAPGGDLGHLLVAYADGALSPEGVAWVEAQLAARPELRQRLVEIRAVQQNLANALSAQPVPVELDDARLMTVLSRARTANRRGFRRPNRWRTLRWVAAACLAVAATLGFLLPRALEKHAAPTQAMAAAALGYVREADGQPPVVVADLRSGLDERFKDFAGFEVTGAGDAMKAKAPAGGELPVRHVRGAQAVDDYTPVASGLYGPPPEKPALIEPPKEAGRSLGGNRVGQGGERFAETRSVAPAPAAAPTVNVPLAIPQLEAETPASVARPDVEVTEFSREDDAGSAVAHARRAAPATPPTVSIPALPKPAPVAGAYRLLAPGAPADAGPRTATATLGGLGWDYGHPPAGEQGLAKPTDPRAAPEVVMGKEATVADQLAAGGRHFYARPGPDAQARPNQDNTWANNAYRGEPLRQEDIVVSELKSVDLEAARLAEAKNKGVAEPLSSVNAGRSLKLKAPAPGAATFKERAGAVGDHDADARTDGDLQPIQELAKTLEPAPKGREDAKADGEMGGQGAFMAVGAGGGSSGLYGNRTGGAKQRALKHYGGGGEAERGSDHAGEKAAVTLWESAPAAKPVPAAAESDVVANGLVPLEREIHALASELEATRQRSTELTHVAQVARAEAFDAKEAPAGIEQDYSNAVRELADRSTALREGQSASAADEARRRREPLTTFGVSPDPDDLSLADPTTRGNAAGRPPVAVGPAGTGAGASPAIYDVRDLVAGVTMFPGPDLAIPGTETGAKNPAAGPAIAEVVDRLRASLSAAGVGADRGTIEEYQGRLVVNGTVEFQKAVAKELGELRKDATPLSEQIRASLIPQTELLVYAGDWEKAGQASRHLAPAAFAATLAKPLGDGYQGPLQAVLDRAGRLAGVPVQVAPDARARLSSAVPALPGDQAVGRALVAAARAAGVQVRPEGGRLVVAAPVALDPTATGGLDAERFAAAFGTKPFADTSRDARHTFAIDANTASFERAAALLRAGKPVDPFAVQAEHFINAQPADYPAADSPEAFTVLAEAAPAPFAAGPAAARTALVAVGVVAKPAAPDERKPLCLTLAIDRSGSMAQEGGLERIRAAFAGLLPQLRADDRVAIVAFGDGAEVVLPATPGSEHQRIAAALATLATGGATNLAEGVALAYQLAGEQLGGERAPAGAEHRVLLASDGAALRPDDAARVRQRIAVGRRRGIGLLVIGCGTQRYAGAALQRIADQGDGEHLYVGSDDEARALFSLRLLPHRLALLAKDAKVQVGWNPARVSHARLIGYDQRRLAHQDFRNDAVDAGELRQDAQVTALFEVVLVDGGTGPLGTAAVRYHDTRLGTVRELACPLPGSLVAPRPSPRLRLFAAAAELAELLQRGWWANARGATYARLIADLERCEHPGAAALLDLAKRAQALEGKP